MDARRERLQSDLRGCLEGDVLCDDVARRMYATDASLYDVDPLGVVRPRHTADVVALVQYATEHGIALHARGAGTSTSGTALGAGLIVDFSHAMRRVLAIEGRTVRLQPGVVHADLNRRLESRRLIFGPDPANRSVTTMGGVLALNATGSHFPRYGAPREKVISLAVVLADGRVHRFEPPTPQTFSSAWPTVGSATGSGSGPEGDPSHPRLGIPPSHADAPTPPGLAALNLADRLAARSDPSPGSLTASTAAGTNDPRMQRRALPRETWRYARRVADLVGRHQSLLASYRPKVAVGPSGYDLWSTVGPHGPDLSRLMVGSEGTLGLIVEATLALDSRPSVRGVGLVFFRRLDAAAQAADAVRNEPGLAALDLLDRRVLVLARETDPRLADLIPAQAEAMLLVEVSGEEDAEVAASLRVVVAALESATPHTIVAHASLDRAERNLFWRISRRVVPTLYRLRGSTRPLPFVDDLAVPPDRMTALLTGVQSILKRQRITASVFGHAGHGVLHVRPFLDLAQEADLRRMRPLAVELYELTLALGGIPCGSSGTGLARTWYHRAQFGPLYDVFAEVKRIFDPGGIFNPGKITAEVPQPVTKHLRQVPTSESLAWDGEGAEPVVRLWHEPAWTTATDLPGLTPTAGLSETSSAGVIAPGTNLSGGHPSSPARSFPRQDQATTAGRIGGSDRERRGDRPPGPLEPETTPTAARGVWEPARLGTASGDAGATVAVAPPNASPLAPTGVGATRRPAWTSGSPIWASQHESSPEIAFLPPTSAPSPSGGQAIVTPGAADEPPADDIAPPPTVFLPVMAWGDGELAYTARSCNGCGRCRTHAQEERQCPLFRLMPGEEAAPRSKANLVRAMLTGQLDPQHAERDDVKTVADLCIQCHSCRLECPSQVNVPKLVAELKGQYVATNGLTPGDWLLSRMDVLGRWGARLVTLANPALRAPWTRWLLERLTGIAGQRKLPPLAKRPFHKEARRLRLTRRTPVRLDQHGVPVTGRSLKGDPAKGNPAVNGRPLRRVLYFADTFANYHDTELAIAFVSLLRHAGVDVYVPPQPTSSGMAMFTLGAIEAVRALARRNVRILADAVRDGYEIVCTEPAAALCLRHEYLTILDDEEAHLVSRHTHEATAYLARLAASGELPTPTGSIPATVAYHLPCHQRALTDEVPGMTLLGLIPGLIVERIERGCSGMAGPYGLKAANFRSSVRIGLPLIDAVRNQRYLSGTTECSSCRIQMEQGTNKPTIHPIKFLAKSYDLVPSLKNLLDRRSGRRVTS